MRLIKMIYGHYKIFALASILLFSFSQTLVAQPITVPDKPKNLQATPGEGRVTLTWDPPAADGGSLVTKYTIVGGSYLDGITLGYETTNLNFTYNFFSFNLNPPLNWSWAVKAVNSIGSSQNSDSVAAAPKHLSGTWKSLPDTIYDRNRCLPGLGLAGCFFRNEGQANESCNEWLARTGQEGKRTRATGSYAAKRIYEFQCVYKRVFFRTFDSNWASFKDPSWYPVPRGQSPWAGNFETQVLKGIGPFLTVGLQPGNGRGGPVTGTGIDCGQTCSANLVTDADYILTASPNENSNVLWGGDCASAGSNPICGITMNGPKSVTAQYILKGFYNLDIDRTGSGSGKILVYVTDYSEGPPGRSYTYYCPPGCSSSLPQGSFPANWAFPTLTPDPDSGSTFSGWSGDCRGQGDCRLTMDGPKSVNANFSLISSPPPPPPATSTPFPPGKIIEIRPD